MAASTSSTFNQEFEENVITPINDVSQQLSAKDNDSDVSRNSLFNVEKDEAAVDENMDVDVTIPKDNSSKKASTEDVAVNKRPLGKDADDYELENFRKNLLIIFSQKVVNGHDERVGTEIDVKALRKTFKKFGFEVIVHRDFTKDKIMKKLKSEMSSKKDYSDYGCIAVAILTHGCNNGFLRAADQQFSEIEFINHFKVINNQTLITKPRIIIIQACRGRKEIPGVPVNGNESGMIQKDLDDEHLHYYLPVEADMIVLHSSYYDTASMRDSQKGSWFIQEICNQINLHAFTQDLESIMTKVRKQIAITYQYKQYDLKSKEWKICKQMPVVTTSLTRKLFLKKFGDIPAKFH